MILTIDASNIRKGGGVTHLQEVLNAADFNKYGFNSVRVWAPASTLDRIGAVPGLERCNHSLIDNAGLGAVLFRKRVLDRLIDPKSVLLWAPGGTCMSTFRPYVTMVRNFLPFEKEERDRFRYSSAWLRYLYLCRVQKSSFKNAAGLIHISQKTNEVINRQVDLAGVKQVTIHHGLNDRFYFKPRKQRDFTEFSNEKPVRLLYISPINHYKHQDKLVRAVALARAKGMPVRLDLVGSAFPAAKVVYDRAIAECDPDGRWVYWHNEVPYHEVQAYYHRADLYACMSSCETFGMILLEAMASGLPILCSNKSALPEIQGGTCPEVDPENVNEVAAGLERMIRDKALREKCSLAAFERSKQFTWKKCADETFTFLADIARKEIHNRTRK